MQQKKPTKKEAARLIYEFEGWLMDNKIGHKNTGKQIPIPQEFDESTMMIYHIKEFDRIFVVTIDEIPKKFLRGL